MRMIAILNMFRDNIVSLAFPCTYVYNTLVINVVLSMIEIGLSPYCLTGLMTVIALDVEEQRVVEETRE